MSLQMLQQRQGKALPMESSLILRVLQTQVKVISAEEQGTWLTFTVGRLSPTTFYSTLGKRRRKDLRTTWVDNPTNLLDWKLKYAIDPLHLNWTRAKKGFEDYLGGQSN